MSRRLTIGLVAILVVAVAAYWFGFRQKTVEADVQVPQLVASIGEGEEAVGVAGNGAVGRGWPPPEDAPLPRLPLDEVPEGGRGRGTALEQVRVLAAAPEDLRPYVESSYFGESGVDVTLTTGVEVRFGDATQAARKWRAAVAIIADPYVTALDYVNVQAPSRASYGGSEHELPPAP